MPDTRLIWIALTAAFAGAGSASEGAAQTPVHSVAPGEPVAGATLAQVSYPVASRDLSRGEVLTTEDIDMVAAAADEAPRGESAESVVGWRTRRVIAAGEPLLAPAVGPPDLVRAGETVQAVYRGGSVVLRVAGTAAGSAAMGERVLVRVDTRRRLEGVVIGPALVQLDPNESR